MIDLEKERKKKEIIEKELWLSNKITQEVKFVHLPNMSLKEVETLAKEIRKLNENIEKLLKR